MSDLARQLGTALRHQRESVLKVSQRELARTLGVADVTLLKYEKGRLNPTLDKVAEVAEAYGLEVKMTFRKTRRTPPPPPDA